MSDHPDEVAAYLKAGKRTVYRLASIGMNRPGFWGGCLVEVRPPTMSAFNKLIAVSNCPALIAACCMALGVTPRAE